MKDVYEVLNKKEADLGRVRKEVESLRLVAPLLSNESDKPVKKPYSRTKNKKFNTLPFIGVT